MVATLPPYAELEPEAVIQSGTVRVLTRLSFRATLPQSRLEIQINANSRARIVGPIVARVVARIVRPIVVTVAVVATRITVAIVAAVPPCLPPVPTAVSAPVTVMLAVPFLLLDLFDDVGPHLLGFRHEHRRGVQRQGESSRQDCGRRGLIRAFSSRNSSEWEHAVAGYPITP